MCDCPFSALQSFNVRGKGITKGEDDSVPFDAFWSRFSKTIQKHVREIQSIITYAQRLDILHPFPRLGPYPLGHHLGMLQALMVEMRSVEPGKKKATISYSTARQPRATFTVIWDQEWIRCNLVVIGPQEKIRCHMCSSGGKVVPVFCYGGSAPGWEIWLGRTEHTQCRLC